MKSRLAVAFGEVSEWERRHPSERVSGHMVVSGKEASGVRGARVLGRRFFRSFLGLLSFGPGPVVPGWLSFGPNSDVPGSAEFWAWSRLGHWVRPVCLGDRARAHGTHKD